MLTLTEVFLDSNCDDDDDSDDYDDEDKTDWACNRGVPYSLTSIQARVSIFGLWRNFSSSSHYVIIIIITIVIIIIIIDKQVEILSILPMHKQLISTSVVFETQKCIIASS